MKSKITQITASYSRSNMLNMKNRWYKRWVRNFIQEKISEDTQKGDITSKALFSQEYEKKESKALIKAKENGIIAGIEEVKDLYALFNIKAKAYVKDGDRIKKNSTIFELRATVKNLLKVERTLLELLQRMSGIATETKKFVEKVPKSIKIAATRKVLWGYLDKKAVEVGGGYSHRLGLYDAILIKENHLQILKKCGEKNCIEEALLKAWKKDSGNFIEIEVETVKEAYLAARTFKKLQSETKPVFPPCLIMLDNFSLQNIKQTLKILKENDLRKHVILEISGNIHEKNIKNYKEIDVDVISIGKITHSAKILDMSMRIVMK